MALQRDLDLAYRKMARDEAREAEAFEWAEATVGDPADEPTCRPSSEPPSGNEAEPRDRRRARKQP